MAAKSSPLGTRALAVLGYRTIEDFQRMFDKANKAKAGKFADTVLTVGKDLEAALTAALSAKRLHAEQREQYPPKYRAVVSAYFEALSKAVAEKNRNRPSPVRP